MTKEASDKISNIMIKGKWFCNNTALMIVDPKTNEKQIFRVDKPILKIKTIT